MKTHRNLLVGFFLLILTAQVFAQTLATITPAHPIEREIGVNETHQFEFQLNNGEFVRFDAEQKNVDPQLSVSDVSGNELRQMYFEKIAGRTAIFFIAPATAKFILTVKSSGKSAMKGNYRLEMNAPHLPSEEDRRRISAAVILNSDGLTKKEMPPRAEWKERLESLQIVAAEWEKLGEPIFEQETYHQIGIAAGKLRNEKLKQTAFEKTLKLAQSNNDVFGEARALVYLAQTAGRRGDRETEEKNLLKALESAAQLGAKITEAEISENIAAHYSDLFKNEKSRDYLTKAVEIYRLLKDEVKETKARVSLAVTTEKLDRKISAALTYQNALEVFERHRAFYQKANVLRSLGGDALEKKQFETAEKYFTESLALMEKYGEPDDEAYVLLGLGLLRFYQTKHSEADEYFERAAAKLDDYSKPAVRIRILTGQSRNIIMMGKVAESLTKLKAAIELADKIKLQNERIILNALISQIYAAIGQNETAFKYALAAKKLSDEVGDRVLQGNAAIALSLLYQFQGDYPIAVRLTEEAVKIGEEYEQTALTALSYQRLGGLFLELGDLTRAEKAYLKAVESATKTQNATIKKSVALSVAQIYLRRRQFAEAKKQIEAVLTEAKVDPDVLVESYARQILGNLALKEKDYAAAQTHFSGALNLQSKAKIVLGIALSMQGSGDALAGLGKLAEAQAIYGQTLGIFRQIGSPTGEATIFENLMDLENKKGNRRLGIFYGKQSVNILQTVRGSIKPLESEVRRSFLSSVENVYRTLAADLIEENRLAEAMQVLALLKEEEFYQYTRRRPDTVAFPLKQLKLTAVESVAAQKYRSLNDSIAAATLRVAELRSQPNTPENQAEMQKQQLELAGLNGKFAKLPNDLSEAFPEVTAPSDFDASGSIKETWQKKIVESGGAAALLTTLITEDCVYIIFTAKDSQTARKINITQAALNQKIFRLREILEDPRSNPMPLAQELYQILIKPIEADLIQANAATLWWSLDGNLRYLPLATLYDGKTFLVEKYTSAVVTLAVSPDGQNSAPENWRALGAGVSVGDENLSPLPQVAAELKSIVRDEIAGKSPSETGIFAGRRLLDKNFSRANFRDALRDKKQLVHLATHFVFQPGKDTDSFLLLGGGDKLTLADWQTDELLDLGGVELLTLSACKTAVGTTDVGGAEIESFGVVARRRGAKSVLASLWSIADNSAAPLMLEFYRQYHKSKGTISKADALRKAQLVLLKEAGKNRRYQHPAYWGAYIFIGNS